MKTKNRLQVLPRALIHVLLAGLVSLGLFSVASADDGPTQATAVAPAARPQVSQAADHCVADAQPTLAGLLALSTSNSAPPSDRFCGNGFTLTQCSCGNGCRPQNLSPQNFCRFFLCGD
jgi:hypothetical protein